MKIAATLFIPSVCYIASTEQAAILTSVHKYPSPMQIHTGGNAVQDPTNDEGLEDEFQGSSWVPLKYEFKPAQFP